jgi:hypothetical protein
MSRSTFKVLFNFKRNAPKKNRLIPVRCRIMVDGKVSQFSSKLDVEENRMLDKICAGINRAYQKGCTADSYVTTKKVRNTYLGLGQNHKTLLAVFRQQDEDYPEMVAR